jgi:hypothetical protein
VPSTQGNKFLEDRVEVGLDNISYTIKVYDTPLGVRWFEALRDNLAHKRVLEKNFCFLGWADSNRNLQYLVNELNKSVQQINSYQFHPPYEKIHPFVTDDFQYSAELPTGLVMEGDLMQKPGLRLKHEGCNLLHRHFEELQGTAWELSEYYKQADIETKYAIRQLNNICHEIEGWVDAYRQSVLDPEWIRPSQITTFLNAPRHDLKEEDFGMFVENRYKRELGGVYLHWSQIGKTLFEVFRDEDGKKLDQAICSTITHQRFYSGEFDVEWGKDIDEGTFDWKKEELDVFRTWLADNHFDWNDPQLALGYAKIGQVDLQKSFGTTDFRDIYTIMSNNLNISSIKVVGEDTVHCDYPYSLDNKDWKEIQKQKLRDGYESRSLR